MTQQVKYYHGGAPGLRMVLPPCETKEPTCASYGAEGICRRDRVYVITSMEAACIFAAMHYSGGGHVYEVEPLGELVLDPDYKTTDTMDKMLGDNIRSYECDRARVIKRVRVKGKLLKQIKADVLRNRT